MPRFIFLYLLTQHDPAASVVITQYCALFTTLGVGIIRKAVCLELSSKDSTQKQNLEIADLKCIFGCKIFF